MYKRQALDWLVEKSGKRVNLEVDFFGGEPLMNFPVIKRLVEYGRSIEKEKNKHFKFTTTTNCVAMTDEIMDFLNKEMDNVVISMEDVYKRQALYPSYGTAGDRGASGCEPDAGEPHGAAHPGAATPKRREPAGTFLTPKRKEVKHVSNDAPQAPGKGEKGPELFSDAAGCCGAGICGLVTIYHLCACLLYTSRCV